MLNGQSTILDVLGKIPQKQETLEDCNNAITAALKAQAKLDEKNGLRRHEWRSELEDLDRRLKGAPTSDQAEAAFASLKSSIDSAAQVYKDQIAEAREVLQESWLTPLERTHLNNKIEVLNGELSQLVRDTRCRLSLAEGRAKDAPELDKLRPRWEELKKRAAAVDKAIAIRI